MLVIMLLHVMVKCVYIEVAACIYSLNEANIVVIIITTVVLCNFKTGTKTSSVCRCIGTDQALNL